MKKLMAWLLIFMLIGCNRRYREDTLVADYKELSESLNEDIRFQEGLDVTESNRITDDEMLDSFHQLYGLRSLSGQELLWEKENDILQMNFYFNGDVSLSEIDTARYFVFKKFVLGIVNNYSLTAYEFWMQQNGRIRKLNSVKCRIYIDNQFIFQENFENTERIGCYENKLVLVKARQIPLNDSKGIKDIIEKGGNNASITLQKSITNETLWLLIASDNMLPISELENLQANVKNALLSYFEAYSSIQLILRTEREIYFCHTWNQS